MTRGGLARHLATCSERQAAIQRADQGKGAEDPWYHLQIQDAGYGDYWLHIEIRGSASLAVLDQYLRAIWLECCGHLSQFSVGGWSGQEIAKNRKIAQVFQPGVTVTHIYDFGTSSETLIKLVGTRTGKALTRHPIVLLARNDPFQAQCIECEQPAIWLCIQCLYEDEAGGVLCDRHAEEHPHTDYGEPMPLVNSPRVGMCGYGGPAEPPY
ncbi:MAG TPA: hypothetical protein VFZ66_19315 [Herpetosiphonaceae bacterium]